MKIPNKHTAAYKLAAHMYRHGGQLTYTECVDVTAGFDLKASSVNNLLRESLNNGVLTKDDDHRYDVSTAMRRHLDESQPQQKAVLPITPPPHYKYLDATNARLRGCHASMEARMSANIKPLGGKAYGSTPHLPGSRIGPGDHHCHEGQRLICEERARDRHDRVIVTEKLDGSNVAVAKINGRIVALTRAGYAAITSPYPQHHYFAWWVDGRKSLFDGMLDEGGMVNGEWLILAHGTRYELPHDPFVAFSMAAGKKRLPWDVVVARCSHYDIVLPRVISDGPPITVSAVKDVIVTSGHGAIDSVEGAVWRVEYRGEFDFLAKWVSPDKQDGKYLTDITGHPEVWHWRPAA